MSSPTPSGSVSPRRLDSHLILTLCLCIFAIAPLFYPGYFQTHAGFVPLWSVQRLRENLFDFSWLPVLAPFNPWRSGGLLPYYLAALLPFSALNSAKVVSLVGIVAGSSGLYLWLKSWVGPQGATVAAMVYTYAPFTMVTLYVRGAWSEAFFWGFLPWALLAATYLVAQPRLPIIIIGVLFWAALGLCQLGLTLWAFVFLVAMQLIFHRPQALWPIIAAALGLLAALGLTFARLNQTLRPSEFSYQEHLVYPSQFLSAFWGYGLSQPGWDDGLSFSLGLAALGLALLTIIIWRGGPDRRPWFFVGMAACSVLVSSQTGGWFWRIPGLDHLLSYPWQLLGFAALGLAVLAGVGFWLEPRLQQTPLFAAVIIFALLPIYPHLSPQYTSVAIPDDPLAIYGQNEIVLLAADFFVQNPDLKDNPDLPEDEQFLPITVETALKPNTKIFMEVAWQALKPIAQNYKTFAHLIDTENQLLYQNDRFPQDGTRPTDSWRPGEVIEDTYQFTLNPRRTTYPQQVWLGFYDEESFVRLPVLGDDQGRAFLNVR